ncbi:K Homology domain [Babesia duncani]|uniref:K Homology domain n=1 Tax=Babesia duncani TaxID=323732 RepID=A0AAD9UNW5_9APIC|nr:K Homology domain [Babesia duncani]
MTPLEIPTFDALVSTFDENELSECKDDDKDVDYCLNNDAFCNLGATKSHDEQSMLMASHLSNNSAIWGMDNDYSWSSTLSETNKSCAAMNSILCDSFSTQLSCGNNVENNDCTKSPIPLYDYFDKDESPELFSNFGESTPKLMARPPGFSSYYDLLKNDVYSFRSEPLFGDEELSKNQIFSQSTNKESHVFLKILATQLVSGTIIGRGGKGLNWFRRKSKVGDIMLSMPWELYPKTEYRTLLLKGTVKSVLKATCIIADLMLSKYSAQHPQTYTHSDKMIVMVVLPSMFLSAMDEIKRSTNPTIINISLFRASEDHKEIVAVLKGNKTKIKELIAAVCTSIAETVNPEDYCFVSYPNSWAIPMKKDDSQEQTDAPTIENGENNYWRYNDCCSSSRSTCPTTNEALARELPSVINMDYLKEDKNIQDHQVQIIFSIPENLMNRALILAATNMCNINIISSDEEGQIKCDLTGPLGNCYSTASLILDLE